MPAIYNSRDERYKSPFGAVPAGQTVTFTLRVPAEYGCQTPYLFIRADEGATSQIALEHTGSEGGAQLFTAAFTPEEPGLFFYYFDLWVDYRKLYAGRSGEAVQSTGEGPLYQLTVYDGSFTTPKEVHGGVMYQVFPDRFLEGNPGKELGFSERIYRADKDREPYFWPVEQEGGQLTKDYYGGDLEGIRRRLPYLHSLGVNWLYLNPIFEAHSNHRYNTADYLNVDPYLGTNEDFEALCREAAAFGMRIILDGVFSHTGADSLYFNKEGRYPTFGAWQGVSSPYRPWYKFHKDGSYDSWWGFDTLPVCDKANEDFRQFITGEGGVVDTWMSRGAAGFRLDVADELPDDFIRLLRTAVKRHGEDKLLIGEVWEDASNKTAYGVRRRYFGGQELDGVMNYPFRSAILNYLKDFDAAGFSDAVMSIYENYPPPAMAATTNHLSTHDSVRAITELAGEPVADHDRFWQSGRRLSTEQYHLGIVRMKLAFVLQYTLPGVPCVYYGDEIAMQGYKDPFNRGYYNWNSSETHLIPLMMRLGKLRQSNAALADGSLRFCQAAKGLVVYERRSANNAVAVAVNCANQATEAQMLGQQVTVPVMGYKIVTQPDS